MHTAQHPYICKIKNEGIHLNIRWNIGKDYLWVLGVAIYEQEKCALSAIYPRVIYLKIKKVHKITLYH